MIDWSPTRLHCPQGSVFSRQPSELLPETCWCDPISAEPPQFHSTTRGQGPDPPHTPEALLLSVRGSAGPRLVPESGGRETERTERRRPHFEPR